jgi:hypothetical protein
MVTLRVRVSKVGSADRFDLTHERVISKHRTTQIRPVPPPPARDHVVDGGECEVLMVEMSVEHSVWREPA